MRAVVVSELGGPEVLTVTDRPDPKPGPGKALVEVAAAGVNFIDIYHRTGNYPMALPFVPGVEGAGTVVELGDGVHGNGGGNGLAPGTRVTWAMLPGAYAEYAVIDADRLVPVPDDVSDEQAAAVLLQGMTAHYLTVSTYPVQPGDHVVVHAAAGGMGTLLTQMVKARGGRVIGTVSTPEKEALAREVGADEIIRYTELDDIADLAAEVRRLTDGHGAAVVYDGVGADTFDASLASLRPRGMLVLYGASSGPVSAFDPQRLNAAGSVTLARPSLPHHVATRDELLWRATDVLGAVADGTLTVAIGGRYTLAEAGKAHEDLASRRTTGKLLVLPKS
jgi:NADPH2:quinone reductase